jgi:hypothetical protein
LYYPSHIQLELTLKNIENLNLHVEMSEAFTNLIKQKGLAPAEFNIDLENEEIVVNKRDLACDLLAKKVNLRFDSDALVRLSELDILAMNKYHSAIEKIILNLQLTDLKLENQRINAIQLGYQLFDLFEQFYVGDSLKATNAQFLLNRLFEPESFKFTVVWQKVLEKWQITYIKELSVHVKNIKMAVP